MTELETIARAKMYIDKLANGINPLDDTAVAENDVVNNVRISRCLFFVSDTLRKVLENGGVGTSQRVKKSEFNITPEELEKFEFSDKPIPVSEIAKRVNEIADIQNSKKFSHRMITTWLIEIGMLIEVESAEGKKSKRPTTEGNGLAYLLKKEWGKTVRIRLLSTIKRHRNLLLIMFLRFWNITSGVKRNAFYKCGYRRLAYGYGGLRYINKIQKAAGVFLSP